MSSRVVRQAFRGWLADPAIAAICPFYETINQVENPTDDIWFTVEFNLEFSEVLTFCRGSMREDGTVSLIFETLPGVGDDQILTAAEAVAAIIQTKVDPTGRVVIRKVSPPDEFSAGGADEAEYRVIIDVDYVFFK